LSAAQMIPFADDEREPAWPDAVLRVVGREMIRVADGEAEPEPALLSTLPFSRTEF